MKELPWTAFKSFIQNRSLSIQYIDIENHYYMWAYDGPMGFSCSLYKDSSSDVLDFENNLKSLGNKSFSDSDGMPLQRLKIAANGAKFKLHCIYFKTADLDSLKERKSNGNSFNYSVLKLYDSQSAQITDGANEGNATRTIIEFEPPITYEIIGGGIFQKTSPATSIIGYAVFAPTIPEAYGGSVHFMSECHLDLLPSGYALDIDGYVPKKINYDSVNHSGRFNFTFDHNAGIQHELMIFIKMFIS